MKKNVEKILIVRFSSLGDVVLTTPVLGALKAKFPRSRIFFLTKVQYGDLLRADPLVSSLIEFDPSKKHKGVFGFVRLLSELRSHRFDLLIDLHANLRSFFVRHMSGARMKLKYKKRWVSRFLMVHCKFVRTKAIHTVDSYLKVLEDLRIRAPERNPSLQLSREDEEFAHHFLLEQDVEKDDIVIGVHPGARWETKRWDSEKFAEVSGAMLHKLNCRILLLGDAREDRLIYRIKSTLPGKKVMKAAGLSLGKLAGLIARCDCLLTNDSGPMHLASALRVPVVAIFGPTHPQLGFAPLGSGNAVLCANVECSPCSLHGEKRCRKKSRFCMDLIDPGMVVEAAENLLRQKKSDGKEA